MRSAECIVDIDVSEGSECLGEVGIVLGLFLVEADVLDHDCFAFLDGSGQCLCALADNVSSELHFKAQLLGEILRNGLEGEFRLELTLRTTEVRAKDDLRLVVKQVLDGGQRTDDALRVRDVALAVKRHVKVAADQHSLTGYVDVLYCLLAEIIHNGFVPFRSALRTKLLSIIVPDARLIITHRHGKYPALCAQLACNRRHNVIILTYSPSHFKGFSHLCSLTASFLRHNVTLAKFLLRKF